MLQQTFNTLADNEQWLAENHDKTVHANGDDISVGVIDLAAQEEHVLRCLGAALIMQWNTLPQKLQRELFDNASSMISGLSASLTTICIPAAGYNSSIERWSSIRRTLSRRRTGTGRRKFLSRD
jgi:hypothetical protein